MRKIETESLAGPCTQARGTVTRNLAWVVFLVTWESAGELPECVSCSITMSQERRSRARSRQGKLVLPAAVTNTPGAGSRGCKRSRARGSWAPSRHGPLAREERGPERGSGSSSSVRPAAVEAAGVQREARSPGASLPAALHRSQREAPSLTCPPPCGQTQGRGGPSAARLGGEAGSSHRRPSPRSYRC